METLKKARTDKEILEEAKERLKRAIDENSEERRKQKDDLLFSTLEQWPSAIRSSREGDPNGARPCLTIDQINQYIVQVVNDMRQNRPSVKARPVDDKADIQTAEIFQGVIRQIEDQSVAQIPYMGAGESAVRVGEGYFRFITEYENEKTFNQVIRVKKIPDMFCVYLGPHIMPDGSDAEYGFVFEDIPLEKFRRMWPKAKYHATDFSELENKNEYCGEDEKIRVCEYFYFDYTNEELVFTADGQTMLQSEYDELTEKPEITEKRTTKTRKTKWCKLTAIEILEKSDWAGIYIPIVKVTGKEAWVDGRRLIWGLVRPAKDSLRMYNYVASTIVEKFALAPKAPFIGAKGQFEGVEDRWARANVENQAYLEYNPISIDGLAVPKPERQKPAEMEVALYQFLTTCREDVQSSLGMFKASLGKEQPNQSGKAILALTRESDTGTFHFSDNLSLSIQHGGKILIDLIPKIYDTQRVLHILGEDGKVTQASINPEQPEAVREVQDIQGNIKKIYNLGVGTYDVTVTVGPSFNTKRMEAATLFTDLATNAKDPNLALVANYLAIKNSDFNGAELATEMIEKLMPPGMIKQEGQPEIPPQVAQQMQMMEQAGNELLQENQELKAGTQEAMAKIQAQAEADKQKIALQAEIQAQQLQFDKEKAAAEMELERAKAIAQIELEKMKIECSADADIEMAIAKIKNLALLHETKMKSTIDQENAARETEEAESEAKNGEESMKAMNDQFAGAMKEMVEALTAKKKINLIKKDGQTVGAEVV